MESLPQVHPTPRRYTLQDESQTPATLRRGKRYSVLALTIARIMLKTSSISPQPVARFAPGLTGGYSGRPSSRAAATSTHTSDESPEFIAVSTSLRRLLLQAQVAGPLIPLANFEGEPGTGKHHLAQTIHRRSSVAHLPFRRQDARLWLATEPDMTDLSGTLYLDQADQLAPGGQALLLHLIKRLQDSFIPDFQLMIASHAGLRPLASQGLFLADLAFRLSAVRFALPPLRDHREDIAPITQALIDRICRRYQQPTAILASGALQRLLQHGWPGNVRELASLLEAAILESSSGVLTPASLTVASLSPARGAQATGSQANPDPTSRSASAQTTSDAIADPLPADLTLDAVILQHIQRVLELNRGNKLRTARQLGISRSTLYRLLSGESTLRS